MIAALLFSISITSVTPSSGPVAGGTTVMIHGSGFDAKCDPRAQACNAVVLFGYVPAASFQVIDPQTIVAVTPAEIPDTVDIGVSLPPGAAVLQKAFTFAGNASDAFDTILLPIFTPAANGSFGSIFVTRFYVWNLALPDVPLFAFAPPPCNLATCIGPFGPVPVMLKARDGAPITTFVYDGDPGRLLYVSKGAFDHITASLRVADVSRSNDSAGTKIPVVTDRDFRSDFLALIDVPGGPNFRNTLRIYSLDPQTSVHVRLVNSDSTRVEDEMDVDLRDPADIYHPGYAQVPDVGVSSGGRIEIEPRGAGAGKRIWALLSATSNDTQQITIVAPR
jgi:IPT/TIG domain-containing protein